LEEHKVWGKKPDSPPAKVAKRGEGGRRPRSFHIGREKIPGKKGKVGRKKRPWGSARRENGKVSARRGVLPGVQRLETGGGVEGGRKKKITQGEGKQKKGAKNVENTC